jgi:hypothetical protein
MFFFLKPFLRIEEANDIITLHGGQAWDTVKAATKNYY